MSPALRLWMIVMLGAGSLFTGGIVWSAWERVWIWRRLPLTDYAVDFRRSVRKADPALPILGVTCGTAAGVFASLTSDAARTLTVVGIGLLAVVNSIVLAEPVNSQFRRRREGDVPPDAERLREFWRRFHLVRTGLAVTTLAFVLTAVTYA